ncbi:uncharacterized protein [Nicotiana sylvestris]|uniref:uncharacterized protein n=1 Tax=Nicotiana sylvestris TaxID=4096 RepID=UPI00388CD7E0
MDHLASEKDSLREQLASTESQFRSAKEEGHKFNELHTETVAELSANAWDREISATAELNLSCAVTHARLESRRQTLEEVHAKGFVLSAKIEKVKALEEEAVTLLYTDEDSVSDFESGEDEDEVPEGEKSTEGQTTEDMEENGSRVSEACVGGGSNDNIPNTEGLSPNSPDEALKKKKAMQPRSDA